ncbi:MAG: cation:proton antiporter [Lachnospiraceae bacterium]|nr:cation:proton antiporter [Lachnospiraceae bacterium]
MDMHNFLLDLALILLCTKAMGLLTKQFKMPQVVGALLAGVLLGPAMFNILETSEFISELSEIGVIVLMFSAGLETDIQGFKKCGFSALIIAILGVVVPFIGGMAVSYFFNGTLIPNDNPNLFMQNIFIGVILTATSVSITVETLKELGKLNERSSNAILGAAIIDDILGIIALTIVTSMADTSGASANIGIVLLKIVAFFILSLCVGYIFYRIFKSWTDHAEKDMRRFVIASFVFCLLLSFVAEEYFGVADITGAYLAGLVISQTNRTKYIASRFEHLSYIMLSPIFFASIGINAELPQMTPMIVLFSVIMVIVAVMSKMVGCGLGAKLFKYNNQECIQIGSGMVSRGEVALIVANKGAEVGLMPASFMGPIIIMVIATTIISPILLKVVFKDKKTENVAV